MKTALSACVTTLNNESTLAECLRSVSWADEVLVLDSGSEDDTVAIAKAHGASVHTRTFEGYGPQKQKAVGLAKHHWILLLDADEALSQAAREEIEGLLMAGPDYAAYTLPRREQMFWTWQHPLARANRYLRLFDRRQVRLETEGVHAAPHYVGKVGAVSGGFDHYGEPDIATKVNKVNHYSSSLAQEKHVKGRGFARTKMLVYPPFAFLRAYVFKRLFLNGWAGFISAVVMSNYAFLKYAKLYEAQKQSRLDANTRRNQ